MDDKLSNIQLLMKHGPDGCPAWVTIDRADYTTIHYEVIQIVADKVTHTFPLRNVLRVVTTLIEPAGSVVAAE